MPNDLVNPRPSHSVDLNGEGKSKEVVNGDDPFLVMFEIDDPENPKVLYLIDFLTYKHIYIADAH